MADVVVDWNKVDGNDEELVLMGVVNGYYIVRKFYNPFEGCSICAYTPEGKEVASVKVMENESRYQAFIRAISNCFYNLPCGDVKNDYVNERVQMRLKEYDRQRKYAW